MGIEAQLKSRLCTVWAGNELPLYVYTKISMVVYTKISLAVTSRATRPLPRLFFCCSFLPFLSQVDENLTEEERKAAWEEYDNEKKGVGSLVGNPAGNLANLNFNIDEIAVSKNS